MRSGAPGATPGRKVQVVAIAPGFDGLCAREVGDRFEAFWPDGRTPPSWQQEATEYDAAAKAAGSDGKAPYPWIDKR